MRLACKLSLTHRAFFGSALVRWGCLGMGLRYPGGGLVGSAVLVSGWAKASIVSSVLGWVL